LAAYSLAYHCREVLGRKGCRTEGRIFIGFSNCTIRTCCREKGFETCANCDEFGKCEMLKGFLSVPNHKPAKINLQKIREKL
jgi:hypothetical protein